MRNILIYSPGAFQKSGHNYDYTKGLGEAFIENGYSVTVFGMDGPLELPSPIKSIKVEFATDKLDKQGLLNKIRWGFKRMGKFNYLLEQFIEQANKQDEDDILLFETFEYFTLGRKCKSLKQKYLTIFHDTNFDFRQTSMLVGAYKYLCRWPSRKIVKNSLVSFVHGKAMQTNLTAQLGQALTWKIAVLPYGANKPRPMQLSIDQNQLKQKFDLNPKLNYLLSFGTLREDKEFEPILEALKNTQNWGWIVAGPESDYSYKELNKLVNNHKVNDKVFTFQRFILAKEQADFFDAADLAINLYKPYIRHESGTVQLARTYGKPVVVSGPPDLIDYVEKKNVGWIVDQNKTLSEVLDNYEKIPSGQLNDVKQCIYNLAMDNSWQSVAGIIASRFETTKENNG